MPRKKIRKPKTREYLENLLDKVGLTDGELAQAIKNGIESENATERAKALEMAGQWKGFAEVDKKGGDDIEHLPLANVALADLDRLCNRCSYCKHKQFEPINRGKVEPPKDPVMGPAVVPTESAGEIPIMFPLESVDCSELLKTDSYPIMTEAVNNMVTDTAALENSAMEKLNKNEKLTEAESKALEDREEADDRDSLK